MNCTPLIQPVQALTIPPSSQTWNDPPKMKDSKAHWEININ